MVINIGWPSKLFGDFTSTSVLDDYHKKEYGPIIQAYNKDPTDFYTIKHILQAGLVNREAVHLLPQPADRTNFLVSPAMPIFPKAFNFAGLGSVAGHELMHGFDDEGIQFDKSGAIICSDWNVCGWMDRKSVKGFTDMAQCVVTQYSTQCCPEKTGYVRCANGATTQGENIADIGGLESTYNAYVTYMKNQSQPEKRLPGLEQFTPNQLFWMYYANTWCTSSFLFHDNHPGRKVMVPIH
ncbi:peptidase family M13 [Cooperia oncophora]